MRIRRNFPYDRLLSWSPIPIILPKPTQPERTRPVKLALLELEADRLPSDYVTREGRYGVELLDAQYKVRSVDLLI